MNQTTYIPHILRSHPFRFLFLPLCVVFLFIFLWFALYPLIHVYAYRQSIDASENWFWFYWPVALLLFLFLLILLLFMWRCKTNGNCVKQEEEEEEKCILNNKRKENEFYTSNNSQSVELVEITPAKAERLFPRCSVRNKPEKLQIDKVVIHDEPKNSTTLSPRELFFKDLLQEADNKSNSSTVFNAKNQAISLNTKKNEYFIASVSPKQENYKNNIFMFVNVGEEDVKIKKAQF